MLGEIKEKIILDLEYFPQKMKNIICGILKW